MKIMIKGYLNFLEVMENKGLLELEVEHATIREVLVELSNRYGEEFRNLIFKPQTEEVQPQNMILINGRHYRYLQKELDTEINDGDILSIFPPAMGG